MSKKHSSEQTNERRQRQNETVEKSEWLIFKEFDNIAGFWTWSAPNR